MKKLTLALLLTLAGCGGGGGGGTAAPPFDPAPMVGTYTGAWHNLTFGTTGNATIDFSTVPATKHGTIVLTLTGNVFGAPAPGPQTLSGTYDTAKLTVMQDSPLLGHVTMTINSSGGIIGSGTGVPGGVVSSITYNGSVLAKTINLNYQLVLVSGASASGNVVVTRP